MPTYMRINCYEWHMIKWCAFNCIVKDLSHERIYICPYGLFLHLKYAISLFCMCCDWSLKSKVEWMRQFLMKMIGETQESFSACLDTAFFREIITLGLFTSTPIILVFFNTFLLKFGLLLIVVINFSHQFFWLRKT